MYLHEIAKIPTIYQKHIPPEHIKSRQRISTFLSKAYGLLINYQHCTCSHAQTLLRGHDYSVRLLRVLTSDFSFLYIHPGLGVISGRDLARVEVRT